MSNRAKKSFQSRCLTSGDMVPERSGTKGSQSQSAYTYSNRVVMVLNQELKEWQTLAALLKRQLEMAHHENFNLYCQLKEQKGTTENALPLKVKKKEVLRKWPNESSEDVTTTKKAKKCHYCGRANHKKNDCWKKAGKCFKCGSSEHKIKDCPRFL